MLTLQKSAFGIHHIRESLAFFWKHLRTETHNIYPLVLLFMRNDSWARTRPCEGQDIEVLHPPPSSQSRTLLNICCAGIDSSSRDPGKRVVLGHRYHSSISRKYLRRRVRRWGARSCFIIWWERPLHAYVSKCNRPTSARHVLSCPLIYIHLY